MPLRYIRDGILDSRAVQSVSDSAMLLYYRLMSLVDDYGRYDWDPELLCGKCFYWTRDRWTEERVSQCMEELTKPWSEQGGPLVVRYRIEGREYFQITKFNQRTQSAPRFPGPPPSPNGNYQKTATVGTGNESQRFEEWWGIWSAVRGTARRIPAEKAWVSVVTVENETACIECTQSYLASLDAPHKGFNPDTFLFEQAKEGFRARWPAKATREKQTPLQKAIAESKKEPR